MIVRMWEAKVAPGRLDEAVSHLRRQVVPDALQTQGCLGAEAFRSLGDADAERVVLITRWRDGHGAGWEESARDGSLWERAHAWLFAPV